MRVLASLALPFVLSGCAVPVGLSIASYAADGLSFGASDKSVNDHMISQALGMDCGLFRIFKGRSICQERGTDPDDDTLYLADLEPLEGPARPWGTAAEPQFAYDYGETGSEARDWAIGIELADAPIADDPSARALFGTPPARPQDAPQFVGEYAYKRDRDNRIEAVRERLEAYRAPEASDAPDLADSQNGFGVDEAPQPMIVNVDGLHFGQSMGMRQQYAVAGYIPPAIVEDAGTKKVLAASDGDKAGAVPTFGGPIIPAAWTSVDEDDLNDTEFGTEDLSLEPIEVAATKAHRPSGQNYEYAESNLRFLVVGSFASRQRAQLVAQAAGSDDFVVVEAVVEGQTFYRVVTGPYRVAMVDDAKSDLVGVGFATSWAIGTCPIGAKSTACLPETAVAEMLPPSADRGVMIAAAPAE